MPSAQDFATIVLPHLDAAANLARWLVGDAVLAEDVVQDAVLRALGYFQTYRGGNEKAWFLRIVRNVAYGALSARRAGMVSSLDDPASPGLEVADPAADPEAVLSHGQGLARLDAALAALPAELRECLVLRELETLSYKEIAEVTGVAIGAVMSRLWRARQALACLLAEGERV